MSRSRDDHRARAGSWLHLSGTAHVSRRTAPVPLQGFQASPHRWCGGGGLRTTGSAERPWVVTGARVGVGSGPAQTRVQDRVAPPPPRCSRLRPSRSLAKVSLRRCSMRLHRRLQKERVASKASLPERARDGLRRQPGGVRCAEAKDRELADTDHGTDAMEAAQADRSIEP